jgi:gliding motility-associated-like protein
MKSKHLSFILFLLFIRLTALADTFIVTSNADSGPGTLREALQLAASNGNSSYDIIVFNINDVSEAGRTILFASQLPIITSKLLIDGTTQPGSVIGVSNSKIILKPASTNIYIGLIMINSTDIEIYGLCFNSIKNDPDLSFSGAVYGYSINRVIIGKPGKGNMFVDCGTGIHISSLYNNIDNSSENITIQSNIFGLINNGESAISNYQDVLLENIKDVYIGGTTEDEANFFTAWLEGVDVMSYWTARDTGYLNIWHNYFGVSYITKTSIATTQAIRVRGWFSPCDLSIDIKDNNMYNSIISMDTIVPPFRITGNKVRNIWINRSRKGIIGGAGNEKNFIGPSINYPAINLYRTDSVTITQNAIFCNIKGIALIDVVKPIISITEVTSSQVSGNSNPNAKIEVFGVDTCTNYCENGRIYLGFVFSDALGHWVFPTTFNGVISATSTVSSGKTSEFSTAILNMNNITINPSTCGRNNGSIMGAVIESGTDWHWENEFGNIISNSSNLVNAGAGRYRLIVGIGNNNCYTSSPYYTIQSIPEPQIDPTNIIITHPTCGLMNGQLQYVTSFNSNWSYQLYNNSVLISPDFSLTNPLQNLEAGNYFLNIKLKADPSCFVQYGPFTLTNQSGPSLNFDNIQITVSTCTNSNGSITGITSSNVTGTPFIQWLDSLNMSVGNVLNLQNIPAGKYKLKFKDQSGCDTIITPFYTIPATGRITIDTTGKNITPGGCTTNNGAIRNITATGATNYQWQNLTTNSPAGSTLSINSLSSGNYQLTATNSTGCIAVSPIIVVPQSTFIPINVTNSQIQNAVCGADNGSIRITKFSNDSNYYSFDWVNSITNRQIGSGTAIGSISDGTYLLLATDTNGCRKQIFTATVFAFNKPVIDLTGIKINTDRCSQLIGSITGIKVPGQSGTNTTYTWRDAGNNIVGTSINLINVGAGQYYLNVADGALCTVQTNLIAISNTNDPGIFLQYDDLIIPRNTAATLNIKNFRPGTYILYSDFAGTQIVQQNTSGSFITTPLTSNTDYYIRFIAGSCTSTLTKIKVTVVDKSFFAIPSAFTPNSDGLNDLLHLKVIGLINVDYFRIYNRNGELVFNTKRINDGWDGIFKSILQPTGVYVWMASGKDINGKTITEKGSFVLIR